MRVHASAIARPTNRIRIRVSFLSIAFANVALELRETMDFLLARNVCTDATRRDATLHMYIVVRYRESSVRSHSGVLSIRAKKKKSTRGSFLRVNKSEKAVAKSNRSWLIDLASFS